MRLVFWRLAVVFALTASMPAAAGGVSPKGNLTFVEGGPVVAPRSDVKVEFTVAEYFYGAARWAYVPVAIVPSSMPLNALPRPAFDLFNIYGVPASGPTGSSLAESAKPYQLSFRAPEQPGRYRIVLGAAPHFRDAPMKSASGYKQSFLPHSADLRELAEAMYASRFNLKVVGEFVVTAVAPPPKIDEPRVYLQVNGALPTEVTLSGGVTEAPVVFSWGVGPEFKKDRKKLFYRYKLEPQDDDWSAWTTETKSSYTFLQRGVHQFAVQARYVDATTVESTPAKFQFALPKEHVSRPTKDTLLKAPFGAGVGQQNIAFDQVYAKSRALLVGMWVFEDAKNFPLFDGSKIEADLKAMEGALKKNGFEVTVLKAPRIKKEEIAEALDKLVHETGRDDRIFVYFSTHGFPDPLLPTDGYLATSDCIMERASVRCLRLNDLQTHADRALDGKNAKQVLFAVDSCFSGLGIARKASGAVDLARLAVPKGAFMLTAGMSNQMAQIDPALGMSTFTHYLVEGLNGRADVMGNNGLITLSELYVYVQYHVAARTNAQQIPMLGRIKGDGEMLFRPRQ